MCFTNTLPSILLHVFFLFGIVFGANPNQWRSRSIYQLLTDRFATSSGSTTAPCPPGYQGFCGGTWRGITRNLDYIHGMGFDAIWISPVTEQISDVSRAWHGYSQKDLYGLNSHFGTAQDLKNLAAALHNRGMYLMVDIVTNHFGYEGSASNLSYPSMHPFDRKTEFHPVCFISNYKNQTEVEKCWLGDDEYPLVDVDTSLPSVQTKYNTWIRQLISNYSIDGLRIDTVKHVEKKFWSSFQSAANIYAVGEVANGDNSYVCPYQNDLDGVLNYPMYYQLTSFFANTTNSPTNLIAQMKDLNQKCSDPTLLAPFAENHDQPRFANQTQDIAKAMNAITFTLLADGIPIVYSGQEQHLSGGNDPFNREAIWLQGYRTDVPLYQLIKRLNGIRKWAIKSSRRRYLRGLARVIYSDDHNLVIKKGHVMAAYTNLGSWSQSFSLALKYAGFAPGSSVTNMLSCSSTNVGSDGTLNVYFKGGLPLVFFPTLELAGSGICGH